jgi:hypothetical protein
MLRVHATVFRELDGRLLAEHGLGIDAYGVSITLVVAPSGTLTIGELGERRNLSPSGVSRSVDRARPDGGGAPRGGLCRRDPARLASPGAWAAA